METRKMRLGIKTYGKAPAKFGADAYKVGLVERVLLVRWGWAYAGSGRGYEYVRSPDGKAGRKVVIEAAVPTDAEILRLALEMHTKREPQVVQVAGFIVQYRPAAQILYKYRDTGAIYADGTIDPPGEEQVVRGGYAEFDFGAEAPYGVRLTWEGGDEAEPIWRRYERGVEP